MAPLSGRWALVTGGSSGIGLAITRALMLEGVRVAVVSLGSEHLRELTVEVPEAIDPLSFKADIRERRELEGVRDALVRAGVDLNILVANAGVNARTTALDFSDADLRSILDTNLYGTFLTLQVFAPLVAQHPGGRVIVTSSVSAIHGMLLRAPYTATKAGLSGLVRSLAIEWGPLGVTVNAIGPGIIDTPLTAQYIKDHPERAQAALTNTPLGRIGKPEDVADAVAFLASDRARFITGQTLYVDGGLSAGSAWW
jgi:3-oxoacyl-[acyl-carrier protein] reductase